MRGGFDELEPPGGARRGLAVAAGASFGEVGAALVPGGSLELVVAAGASGETVGAAGATSSPGEARAAAGASARRCSPKDTASVTAAPARLARSHVLTGRSFDGPGGAALSTPGVLVGTGGVSICAAAAGRGASTSAVTRSADSTRATRAARSASCSRAIAATHSPTREGEASGTAASRSRAIARAVG